MEYIIYCRETPNERFRAKRVASWEEARTWCAGWRNSHGIYPVVFTEKGEWVPFRELGINMRKEETP